MCGTFAIRGDKEDATKPSQQSPISRNNATVAFATVALGAALVFLGPRDYPHLHSILDAGAALLSAVLAALFWDLGQRFDHPFPRRLAVSFAVTFVLEFVHVLVTVEWFGILAPIAQSADSLRPGTWGPSAYILPIGIALSLHVIRPSETRRLAGFTLGMVVGGAVLLWIFDAAPRYSAPGFLGITRPALVGVPLLWAAVGVVMWRTRIGLRLPSILAIAAVVLTLGHATMLYSRSAHDQIAMAAHIGKIGAYLVVLLALMRLATVDMFARIEAEQALSEANRTLEARVADRAEKLLASESRFRALIENSADGIALIAPNGVVLYRSSAGNRLIGRAEDAQLGGYLDPVHPEDHAAVATELAAVLADPTTTRTFQARVMNERGEWRTFEASFTNLIDNPHVGAVIANFRDITLRLKAEEAARERDERFREMAEHIKEAYFVVEIATGKTLYISPTWSEIWGRPIADGYDPAIWFDAVHPDDRELVAASQAAVKNGNADETVFRIVRPDKSRRWVRARAFPVRNIAGEVHRFVGVAEDITELRQAEERFTQAQKMEAVGRLAGGVAHDFNNLLTVILSEAEVVQEALAPDSEESQWMGEIRSAAERAVVLTRQLLAFSRKQLVEPVVFELNDVVTDTGKMLRRLIGEDVRLEIKIGNPGSVRADRGQVEQVVTNLAVNARDAMPDGGTLIIETTSTTLDAEAVTTRPDITPGTYATLVVSDTGTGMTEDVRKHAFEPFFTTKEQGKGTGLGLATCHGIVRQAGGHIAIYSELGLGTTFRVYLPVVGRAAPSVNAPAAALESGTETILFVEDEPDVRRVGARMLRSLGYEVIEARDGVETLRLLSTETRPIDLLFTDVVLPGMGGRELAERVRAARPDIRVLFASGYTDDVILQHQLISHDVALLQKPYTRTTVAQKVRAVLDQG